MSTGGIGRMLWRAVVGIVALAGVVVVVALACESEASAHMVGLSSGEYRLDGRTLLGEIGMAAPEVARWLPAIDTSHDGELDSGEMTAGAEVVKRAFAAGLTVSADGRPCAGALDRAWLLEGDGGAVFLVRYTCASPPNQLTIAAPLLRALAPGHRHLARVFRDGRGATAVLDRNHATWTLGAAPAEAVLRRGSWSAAWSMLKLGVEHILTGADHLVFLLGVILVAGRSDTSGGTVPWPARDDVAERAPARSTRVRALVGVVSAFTVAHSITLALAALGVFAPSPRLVEPAIALSIAYVGIENLFVSDARKRWRVTFLFGLIHGFGFAGALRAIALPRPQVPLALISFNVGVEIGQLAVLSVILPLIIVVRDARWFGERGVKLLSTAIAVGGVVLFVGRVFNLQLG